MTFNKNGKSVECQLNLDTYTFHKYCLKLDIISPGSAAHTGGAAKARSLPEVPRRVWAGSAGLPLQSRAGQEAARGRGQWRGGREW